jgi:3-methyl-2-oxobutanoate hydroxymethyltransferase
VQGRGEDAQRIKADALALQKAGVFAVVLELVPAQLAAQITAELSIPVIGIGAGVNCDAQVLVWTDLMGITENAPKLAKAYRNLRKEMTDAAKEFAEDVATGRFPTEKESFN